MSLCLCNYQTISSFQITPVMEKRQNELVIPRLIAMHPYHLPRRRERARSVHDSQAYDAKYEIAAFGLRIPALGIGVVFFQGVDVLIQTDSYVLKCASSPFSRIRTRLVAFVMNENECLWGVSFSIPII